MTSKSTALIMPKLSLKDKQLIMSSTRIYFANQNSASLTLSPNVIPKSPLHSNRIRPVSASIQSTSTIKDANFLNRAIDIVLKNKSAYTRESVMTKTTIEEIWKALFFQVELLMSQGKSVEIPGFGIFCFQYQEFDDDGKSGKRVKTVPSFFLNRIFSSAFGVKYLGAPCQPSKLVQLSYSAIAKKSGTTREDVILSLKDIFRAIGESSQSTKICVSCGFCTMTISSGVLKCHWSKSFLAKLADFDQRRINAHDIKTAIPGFFKLEKRIEKGKNLSKSLSL